MKLLEEKILKDGDIKGTDVIKVDSFLNHRVEPDFIEAIAAEFAKYFSKKSSTIVLTLESSGIPVAYKTAELLGLPMVFAKKSESLNLDKETYTTEVYSYTRQNSYKVKVSKNYINSDDRVLIIDDFLARGSASRALINICKEAEAEIAGLGFVIEKFYQGGGEILRLNDYDVYSLAIIEKIDPVSGLIFISQEDVNSMY